MSRTGRRYPNPQFLWQQPAPILHPQLSGTIALIMSVQGDAHIGQWSASGTITMTMEVTGDVIVTGKPGQGTQELILFDPDAVLTGSRITYYRFDLLDNDENLIGEIVGVESGDLAFDAYASVKSTGTLTVDGAENVDWLNVRIRPMIRIARLGGGDDPLGRETPAGVYLCAAPVDEWGATGLQRKVELADKLSILDQDIASGDPNGTGAYTALAGSNVITLVKTLIGETGEEFPAIEPGLAVLAADQVWDVGTTRLKVINDLLTAAGYFSLYCDGWGQYRADTYVEPANRDPVYAAISPFSSGPDSVMDPNWTRDRDIYGIPNRVLLVGQGDGDTAALTSVATNTDPNSPYSFAARGRWITVVETGIEAVDQLALDAQARARLSDLTSVTNTIEVKHIYLPDLRVNSVIRFVNPDAQQDILCYVVTTTIPLDPLALCSTTMRIVT